jgi:hypothetical protein
LLVFLKDLFLKAICVMQNIAFRDGSNCALSKTELLSADRHIAWMWLWKSAEDSGRKWLDSEEM